MIALVAALLSQAPPAVPPAAPATPVAQGGGARAGAPPPVQLGVTITPDTVTVGEPFRVLVRVRAPRGASIEFPAAPDSAAAVQALDPRAVRELGDPDAVDRTAAYRLVAWDVGALGLGLDAVTVRANGVSRAVALAPYTVFVRSVLPADSAQRVPKPPRDILADAPPWWRWWALVAALLALLGLLAWWLWRRRRRAAAGDTEVDAYEHAQREFDRVEALGLVEAGERGRFVALIVEVLREYLARRVDGALPSLTSTELLDVVRGNPAVPTERLAVVLAEADLIKFARRPVSAERAGELAREARAVVRDVHVALMPAEELAPEPAQEAAA